MLLVFVMVAAAWALLRAVDDGRTAGGPRRRADRAGSLNEQLQVMLVVPALAVTYLVAGPVRRARVCQPPAALAAMVVAAGGGCRWSASFRRRSARCRRLRRQQLYRADLRL